jgi:hypothetical protein
MRKLFALLFGFLLVLTFSVSVATAQEPGQPYITDLTVTSVKVDRIGNMSIDGYMYCQNMDGWWLDSQGQITQSMGRKTQLRGGVWGSVQCNPNGPTYFQVWSFADWGKFATTFTGVQISFGNGGCDENGCWWNDIEGGGGQWWLKATKM